MDISAWWSLSLSKTIFTEFYIQAKTSLTPTSTPHQRRKLRESPLEKPATNRKIYWHPLDQLPRLFQWSISKFRFKALFFYNNQFVFFKNWNVYISLFLDVQLIVFPLICILALVAKTCISNSTLIKEFSLLFAVFKAPFRGDFKNVGVLGGVNQKPEGGGRGSRTRPQFW